MKKRNFVVVGITIVIAVAIISVVTIIFMNNKEIEKNDYSNETKIQNESALVNETLEQKLDKLIGMNIIDAIEYVEVNHLQRGEKEEEYAKYPNELTVNHSYDVIETEDESLFGKVKGYRIEEVGEYRVATGEQICFEVYGKEYSIEEKENVIKDLESKIGDQGGYLIDSNCFTAKEIVKILSPYNIKYEIKDSLINIQGFHSSTEGLGNVPYCIALNTFDLDTLPRIKEGLVSAIGNQIIDNDIIVTIYTYTIEDSLYNKMYTYMQNNENRIPKSELIEGNTDVNNLPIALNTRYIAWSNNGMSYTDIRGGGLVRDLHISIGYSSMVNKVIYFTYDNKVLMDDYDDTKPQVRYLAGTYSINGNIINIEFNRVVFAEEPPEGEIYTQPITLEIQDKDTLIYYTPDNYKRIYKIQRNK